MRTTIDKAGRVVIPKRLREELGVRGGDEIEIGTVEDGVAELRRARREIKLVRGPNGLLHATGGPGLDAEQVRDLIERERHERLDRWT